MNIATDLGYDGDPATNVADALAALRTVAGSGNGEMLCCPILCKTIDQRMFYIIMTPIQEILNAIRKKPVFVFFYNNENGYVYWFPVANIYVDSSSPTLTLAKVANNEMFGQFLPSYIPEDQGFPGGYYFATVQDPN